jgi:guanyl-specific ribonuclease Sa
MKKYLLAIVLLIILGVLGFQPKKEATVADITVFMQSPFRNISDENGYDIASDKRPMVQTGYEAAKKVVEKIKNGKSPKSKHFGNYEGFLPDGEYKEFDVFPYTNDTINRGTHRLVQEIKKQRFYYTPDHYTNFIELK